MKVRLRHIWEIVSTNYWFVPSVMTLAATIAAFVMLHITRTYFPADIHACGLYSGADGTKLGDRLSRNVLLLATYKGRYKP